MVSTCGGCRRRPGRRRRADHRRSLKRRALALRAVALGERGLDALLGAHRLAPGEQPLERRGGRLLDAALEIDQAPVHAVADRAPEVLLDQPPRMVGERHAVGLVARRLEHAGGRERGERLRLLAGRLGVGDPHLDGAERQMRADRPPDLRALDDRSGGDEELEVLAIFPPRAVGVGHAAARERLGERLRARGVEAAVAAFEERRVGADRQQRGQHRPQPVAGAHRAVGAVDADVDVQREGVVAPRHVLEAVDDAAVVLGVDVLLLAVVGPGMRAGRAERDAVRGGEGEQPRARLALASDRVVQVAAGA